MSGQSPDVLEEALKSFISDELKKSPIVSIKKYKTTFTYSKEYVVWSKDDL